MLYVFNLANVVTSNLFEFNKSLHLFFIKKSRLALCFELFFKHFDLYLFGYCRKLYLCVLQVQTLNTERLGWQFVVCSHTSYSMLTVSLALLFFWIEHTRTHEHWDTRLRITVKTRLYCIVYFCVECVSVIGRFQVCSSWNTKGSKKQYTLLKKTERSVLFMSVYCFNLLVRKVCLMVYWVAVMLVYVVSGWDVVVKLFVCLKKIIPRASLCVNTLFFFPLFFL